MFLLLFCLFFSAKAVTTHAFETAIDYEMHRNALDPKMCEKQLKALGGPTRRLFEEANANIPSNIFLRGQKKFIGNFEKCLSISDQVAGTAVEGKHCRVSAIFPNPFPIVALSNESLLEQKRYAERRKSFKMYKEYGCDNVARDPVPGNTVIVKIDVCIPATCTTDQALHWAFNKSVTFDGSLVPGVSYNEVFCRLAGDKPFTTAEIVAIVIFSLILLLNIASTAYDINWSVIEGKCKPDPIYSSFSLYTNTKKLVNCSSSADTVECADGMRAISVIWIIIFHQTLMYHDRDVLFLGTSYKNDDFELFTSSAINTVDTFFVLSGLFLVYTTASRFSCDSFLGNIHLFYLRRLLRFWPLMAACVLISSSFLTRIADGPSWNSVAKIVNGCQMQWWTIMLFVQNQISFCSANAGICLGHFWYISVDMQLYVFSPLVLVWLFGPRRSSWVALTLALILSTAFSVAFSFAGNFTYSSFNPDPSASLHEKLIYMKEYQTQYYHNPLARAAPFVVGMMAGYLLHCHRKSKFHFNKRYLYNGWILSMLVILGFIYIQKALQEIEVSQFWHNIMNGLCRLVWGSAIAWIIVACHNGYGGPLNWFLSLSLWKLPSKLSYAMYLVHATIIFINKGLETYDAVDAHTNIFALPLLFTQSFVVAFVLSVTIESPVQNLQRIFLRDKIKVTNAKDDTLEANNCNEETGVENTESKI